MMALHFSPAILQPLGRCGGGLNRCRFAGLAGLAIPTAGSGHIPLPMIPLTFSVGAGVSTETRSSPRNAEEGRGMKGREMGPGSQPKTAIRQRRDDSLDRGMGTGEWGLGIAFILKSAVELNWPQEGTRGTKAGAEFKMSPGLLATCRVKQSTFDQNESAPLSLRLLCFFVAAFQRSAGGPSPAAPPPAGRGPGFPTPSAPFTRCNRRIGRAPGRGEPGSRGPASL